ncbi:hypothetical protein ATANTOWER_014845 [Ataeniobius toweri]|uniref:Secreted protein n=1 Tax=Ataeniobius toweri TaxID=208326 RepID=A0ABU7AZ23_9TELE|nr:hypothetical protein [Ataeniobius toweri]
MPGSSSGSTGRVALRFKSSQHNGQLLLLLLLLLIPSSSTDMFCSHSLTSPHPLSEQEDLVSTRLVFGVASENKEEREGRRRGEQKDRQKAGETDGI